MCSRKLFNNDASPNYLFVSLTTSPICHTHRATLARQASWRLLYNHIGQLKVNPQNPHKPADRVQCKHIIPYGQVKTIPPTIEKKNYSRKISNPFFLQIMRSRVFHTQRDISYIWCKCFPRRGKPLGLQLVSDCYNATPKST